VWVGSKLKCNRRQVSSEEHYTAKFEKAKANWEEAKDNYKAHNQGIIVLVFRSTEAVHETIKEFSVV
jgi:hypothetical protein